MAINSPKWRQFLRFGELSESRQLLKKSILSSKKKKNLQIYVFFPNTREKCSHLSPFYRSLLSHHKLDYSAKIMRDHQTLMMCDHWGIGEQQWKVLEGCANDLGWYMYMGLYANYYIPLH